MEEIDPFWRTGANMADKDPLLFVREPYIALTRGRFKNTAVTLPQALRIEGYDAYHRRQFAPDCTATPSQWEAIEEAVEDNHNKVVVGGLAAAKIGCVDVLAAVEALFEVEVDA
jgi:hypothetical protein